MREGGKKTMKEIKVDPNANLTADNCKMKCAREIAENENFDSAYPIVIDEDGLIIDGNHRYRAFMEAGKENQIDFLQISWKKFNELVNKEIENGMIEKFEEEDEYFYQKIRGLKK